MAESSTKELCKPKGFVYNLNDVVLEVVADQLQKSELPSFGIAHPWCQTHFFIFRVRSA